MMKSLIFFLFIGTLASAQESLVKGLVVPAKQVSYLDFAGHKLAVPNDMRTRSENGFMKHQGMSCQWIILSRKQYKEFNFIEEFEKCNKISGEDFEAVAFKCPERKKISYCNRKKALRHNNPEW